MSQMKLVLIIFSCAYLSACAASQLTKEEVREGYRTVAPNVFSVSSPQEPAGGAAIVNNQKAAKFCNSRWLSPIHQKNERLENTEVLTFFCIEKFAAGRMCFEQGLKNLTNKHTEERLTVSRAKFGDSFEQLAETSRVTEKDKLIISDYANLMAQCYKGIYNGHPVFGTIANELYKTYELSLAHLVTGVYTYGQYNQATLNADHQFSASLEEISQRIEQERRIQKQISYNQRQQGLATAIGLLNGRGFGYARGPVTKCTTVSTGLSVGVTSNTTCR